MKEKTSTYIIALAEDESYFFRDFLQVMRQTHLLEAQRWQYQESIVLMYSLTAKAK